MEIISMEKSEFLPNSKTNGFISEAKQWGKAAAIAVGTVALVTAVPSFAAIDTTEVSTNLTAAQTTAEGVGTKVMGFVAALVVVGICIALIKRA